MDNKRLKDLCRRGEQADQMIQNGRTTDALKILTELKADFEKKGDFDSYLAAKLTLSLMLCYVKLGDFKNAYSIWNANLEDSLHGIGIYALESAQTTVEDMIAYDMLCAFLHSIGDSDNASRGKAVNQYLSRVCEHALDEGDRSTTRMALSNWKQHLREVFGSSLPLEHAKPLIQFEKTLGETVKPTIINFPASSSWEKPRDFLEMSYFGSLDEHTKPDDGPSGNSKSGGAHRSPRKKKAS
jgi:hypothetical protein